MKKQHKTTCTRIHTQKPQNKKNKKKNVKQYVKLKKNLMDTTKNKPTTTKKNTNKKWLNNKQIK